MNVVRRIRLGRNDPTPEAARGQKRDQDLLHFGLHASSRALHQRHVANELQRVAQPLLGVNQDRARRAAAPSHFRS